ELVRRIAIQVGHRHVCARFQQRPTVLAPQQTEPAGHDRDLAVERERGHGHLVELFDVRRNTGSTGVPSSARRTDPVSTARFRTINASRYAASACDTSSSVCEKLMLWNPLQRIPRANSSCCTSDFISSGSPAFASKVTSDRHPAPIACV